MLQTLMLYTMIFSAVGLTFSAVGLICSAVGLTSSAVRLLLAHETRFSMFLL
jgi:hypothetical protein